MADFVKQREQVTLTFGTTDLTASANLTSGLNIADAIYFLGTRAGDNDPREANIDIVLASGPDRAIGTRGRDGVTVTAIVDVWEIDTSLVSIQRGTFSMATGVATDSESLTTIDLAKAMHGCFYEGANSSNHFARHYVESWLTTTAINFERGNGAQSNVAGHWWVCSHASDHFAAQQRRYTIDALSSQATSTITSVDMAKTMVIGSNCTEATTNARRGLIGTRLQNATTLQSIVGIANNVHDITATAVEMTGQASVQRTSLTTGATSQTFAVTSVPQAESMVKIPNQHGHSTVDTTAGNALFTSVLNSSIQGQVERGETVGTAEDIFPETIRLPIISAPTGFQAAWAQQSTIGHGFDHA